MAKLPLKPPAFGLTPTTGKMAHAFEDIGSLPPENRVLGFEQFIRGATNAPHQPVPVIFLLKEAIDQLTCSSKGVYSSRTIQQRLGLFCKAVNMIDLRCAGGSTRGSSSAYDSALYLRR